MVTIKSKQEIEKMREACKIAYLAQKAIEEAIYNVLDEGFRTGDIMSEGMKQVTCSEMGDLVAERI